MASTSALRTVARLGSRQVLLAVVVVLLAMVALALLAEAMNGGDGGTVYLAEIQPAAQPGSVPSLVTVGYGKASGPAEVAQLQVLVASTEGYYGGSLSVPTPDATPGAAGQVAAAPIVAAMVAAGAPEDAIQVVTSAALVRYFGPGGLSFRIDVALANPSLEAVNAIVDAAGHAALGNGLQLLEVGAGYAVENCGPLRSAAWQAAAEDARGRDTTQAEQLGVGLGDLLVSHEVAVVGAPDLLGASDGSSACAPVDPQPIDPFSGGTLAITYPSFDPTQPPVVTAFAQVSLAFEILQE